MKKKKENQSNGFFVVFAKYISDGVGQSWVFLMALLLVLIWLFSGPFFHFSDTWQLVLNTVSSAVTFLMVFLIQHTQNRDTTILNLKLDELIKSLDTADNTSIDLEKLSNEELKKLEQDFKKLCDRKMGK
jgi:low affinity Fe/Cu permease